MSLLLIAIRAVLGAITAVCFSSNGANQYATHMGYCFRHQNRRFTIATSAIGSITPAMILGTKDGTRHQRLSIRHACMATAPSVFFQYSSIILMTSTQVLPGPCLTLPMTIQIWINQVRKGGNQSE
jgi:hypothetical protein